MDLEALRQRIAEILATLDAEHITALSAEELSAAQDELLDLFNQAREIGGADALAEGRRAVEAINTVRAESARREEAAAAETAEFEALAAQLEPEPTPEPVPDPEDPNPEDPDPERPQAEDAGDVVAPVSEAEDAPAGDGSPTAPAAPAPEPVAAGAAAPTPQSRPRQSAPVAASRAAAPLTAARQQRNGVPGVSNERPRTPDRIPIKCTVVGPTSQAGATIAVKDKAAVCKAFYEANEFWQRAQTGMEVNVPVLHFEWEYPEEFDLRPIAGDPVAVTAAIDRPFFDEQALTAAGGICAPYPVDYTLLPVIGETVRPVAGALPTFQATRGGVRWMGGYSLADILVNAGAGSAISQYTKQNDIDAVTKPCATFTCKSESSAEVYALVRCFQFGNWNARFYPEMIDQVTGYAMVAWAKYAEVLLLQAIGAGSTQVDYNGDGYAGAVVSLLNGINRACTAFRQRYRAPGFGALRVGLPLWVRQMIKDDLSLRMATGNDQFDIPDTFIDQLIRQRGGEPWYFIDGENDIQQMSAAQAQGPLNDWPNTVVFYIFPEGTWIRLDAGELDLGIVRDSTLNSKNNFQVFFEAWEGIMFRGYESLRVNATLCANGASAGTYPPFPCVS